MMVPTQYYWVLLHATPVIFILLWGFDPLAAARSRRKLVFDGLLFLLLARVVAEFHLRPLTAQGMSGLLILAFGILLAEAVACLAPWVAVRHAWARALGLRLLVASAVVLAFVPASSATLSFQTVARESGVWRDPNLYGVYMALSLVAVVGLLADSAAKDARSERALTLERVLLALAGCIIAGACLRSFSRGAWLAASFGSLFVGAAGLRTIYARARASDRRGLIRKLQTAIWTLSLLALLAYAVGKQIRPASVVGIDSPVTMRLATITDSNDLSWVNRVHAWNGSVKLILEHPLLGTGADGVAPAYAELHKPETVASEAAIKTNDVTFVGAAMGLPVLMVVGVLAVIGLAGGVPWFGGSPAEQAGMLTVTWRGIIVTSLFTHWFNGFLLTWLPGGLFWVALALGGDLGRPDSGGATHSGHDRVGLNRKWLRLAGLGAVALAAFLVAASQARGLFSSPAFYAKDRLFALGTVPQGQVDAIAVMCAPGGEARSGFGGLRQMRDLRFATFAIYPTGNLPIADRDWTGAISKCIDQTPGGRSLPRLHVLFGPGAAEVIGVLLGTPSGVPTKLCWIEVNWLGQEGVNALEGVVRQCERLRSAASPQAELILYCPPEDAGDARVSLATVIDRLERLGVSLVIRVSAAAREDGLRPLALREISGQTRMDFHLPTLSRPAPEKPIDFFALVSVAKGVVLVAAASLLVWWSVKMDIVPGRGRGPCITAAGFTWLLVAIVVFQAWWPPRTKPGEWLGDPMVRPELREDYREVTRFIDQEKVTAAEVLEYVEITARQVARIYPSPPKDLYRHFVLLPSETTRDGTELRFRVELWRFLRGHLASLDDPLAAARVVRQRLLNSVGFDPAVPALVPIGEGWSRRLVSRSQTASLHLAALRAAGVAARLNDGRIEIWAKDQWLAAPPVAADSD